MLTLLGGLVGLVAAHQHADYGFGFELVFVYGFLVTILVAAVYLPTSLALAAVGSRIQDAVFPSLPPNSPEWAERIDKRAKLGSILQLQEGAFRPLENEHRDPDPTLQQLDRAGVER